MKSSVRRAVLPAGGLGTRLLPATKAIPKEMLPIVDKPLIQYAAEEAWAAGVEDLILVIGRGEAAIENHFDERVELDMALKGKGKDVLLEAANGWIPPGATVAFVRQHQPRGLGHAVLCAESVIGDEPFAVLLADELAADRELLGDMIKVHESTGGNVIAVTEVGMDKTHQYGIVDVGDDQGSVMEITRVVEKPPPGEAPSRLAIIGRYILTPGIFERLRALRQGVGGEIQLTDALAAAAATTPFHAYRYEGERFDCGSADGLIEANVAFGMRRPDLASRLEGAVRRHLGD